MKKLLAMLLILAMNTADGFAAFSFVRSVTVDKTKVPSNQNNFPVLVSGTYNGSGGIMDLRTTGNGGKVQNASGYDVGFYTNANCATGKMDWETEYYNATTGVVIYWVEANITSAVDAVFYICYGDSGISTDQSNATGVWDSNFAMVQHFPDGTTLSATDSTSNNNDASSITSTAATGKIGGGSQSNGGTQNVTIPYASSLTTFQGDETFTTSLWFYIATQTGYAALMDSANREMSIFVNDPTLCYTGIGGFSAQLNCTGVTATAWHHLSLVRTDASGSVVAYIDGSQNSTLTSDATAEGNADRVFGTNPSGGGSAFNGIVDEARLSNSARSADWISAEYANQNSPSTFYALGSETAPGGAGGSFFRQLFHIRRGVIR